MEEEKKENLKKNGGKMLDIEERINNVIDELNRAVERIKEIGEFYENTITSDEELVSDMQLSIERMQEVYDIIGLALIMAGQCGVYSKKLYSNSNIEHDSVFMRKEYLKWALDILEECQKNDWEDYYNTAWEKADKEIDRIINEKSN